MESSPGYDAQRPNCAAPIGVRTNELLESMLPALYCARRGDGENADSGAANEWSITPALRQFEEALSGRDSHGQ